MVELSIEIFGALVTSVVAIIGLIIQHFRTMSNLGERMSSMEARMDAFWAVFEKYLDQVVQSSPLSNPGIIDVHDEKAGHKIDMEIVNKLNSGDTSKATLLLLLRAYMEDKRLVHELECGKKSRRKSS